MPRLAEIEAHVTSISELLDIVSAMRSIAGMRLQEAQNGLPAVRRYARDISAAIADAVPLLPERAATTSALPGRQARLLCAAEHGFVGAFNEQLVAAALAGLSPAEQLFVLGSRGAALATEQGARIAWSAPMATRPSNVPETVRRLTKELYRRLARGEIAALEVVHARHGAARSSEIERRAIIPLDLESFIARPGRTLPLRHLPPARLLELLTEEYVFALLTEAALESIAAENAARFASMEAAHENVGKKLDELRQTARRVRQAEITTELIDVVTGAEALVNARS